MLTLTRRIGESIIIETENSQITVIVKEIRRGGVRLGVLAPRGIKIWRDEVYQKKEEKNQITEMQDEIAELREKIERLKEEM